LLIIETLIYLVSHEEKFGQRITTYSFLANKINIKKLKTEQFGRYLTERKFFFFIIWVLTSLVLSTTITTTRQTAKQDSMPVPDTAFFILPKRACTKKSSRSQ
jgi:hypothetical protein